jgi:hypothetical protein
MMGHGGVVFAIAVSVLACSPGTDKTEHPAVRDERALAMPAEGSPGSARRQTVHGGAPVMTPALPQPLEDELSTIRKDPGEAIGFGLKGYLPYEPNQGTALMNSASPEVTARLAAETRGPDDRVYHLAVLHVLGKRDVGDVDAALIGALDDPDLRATAAYLLGRAGYKGYPMRTRDPAKVRAALRAHLEDTTTFEDPFYHRTFRTQDFVIAAYVRVTGVAQFHIANHDVADLIGLGLPALDDATRQALLAQALKAP